MCRDGGPGTQKLALPAKFQIPPPLTSIGYLLNKFIHIYSMEGCKPQTDA